MEECTLPIRRQGSVKAKKAVRTSGYGYGYVPSEKKCGYGSSKKKWHGSSKMKSGYGCKSAKSDHGCKHAKSDCGCKPKKKVCKTVKYVCKPVKSVSKNTGKKAVVARRSAFRAVNAANQPITVGTRVQVAFGQEQFDLGGEYNPATSTFTARQSGVYTFIASVLFRPDPITAASQVALAITVNNVIVATEAATFATGDGTLDTSTIVKLRRGDDVRVIFTSNQAGSIVFSEATHFEGVLNRATR